MNKGIPFTMSETKTNNSGSSVDSNNKASLQWGEGLLSLARHYLLATSPETINLHSYWIKGTNLELQQLAQQMGLSLQFLPFEKLVSSTWSCPFLIQFNDNSVGIVERVDDSNRIWLRLSGEEKANPILMAELSKSVVRTAVARPLSGRRDDRVDDFLKPYEESWLKRIILMDLRPYAHVMIAAFIANVLGLAGIIFSMQVYDRVVPGQSMPTLYVLFIGVLLATALSWGMKILRGKVTNVLGKWADLRVSDRVFGHAIRLQTTAKPKSTGSFIAQLRELEQLRELITSSTIGAVTDMPFFILFLGVFFIIAGPLVWVPLAAVVLMILPALLMQKKLARYANEATRESALRNAMLVETIQGLEDIKSLQAEARFQKQWNHYTEATASASLKLRDLTNHLLTWSQTLQVTVFAVVVFFGAPMVIAGDLTTGALVAASILSSRMLAPMGQLTQVMTRWQHAKMAMEAADNIMRLPVDGNDIEQQFHRPSLKGNYALINTQFTYGEDMPVVLDVKKLNIKQGERIAVLGKNGVGKSSLLHALTGNLQQKGGELLLDDTPLNKIDVADVRRDVMLLSQQSRLFHGSIRDNLMLGKPDASDEKLEKALILAGAHKFIQKLPEGLDHQLLEGGLGLSGGQRQSLLLARLVLRDPQVVLLDEPTASLDDDAERYFLKALDSWMGSKTLIVATHRLAALELVTRIIVLDNGKIVLDAPKNEALKKLTA
jgi:ATP-binding cassette subfamily C protein LapB